MSYTFSLFSYSGIKFIFLIILILFLGGYIGKILIAHRRFYLLQLLLEFPLKLLRFAFSFVKNHHSILAVALFIFFFNFSNSLLYFVSGKIPYLPFILNFWLGMNLGVAIFAPPELKKKYLIEGDNEGPKEDKQITEKINFDSEEAGLEINGGGFLYLILGLLFMVLELGAIIYSFMLAYSLNFLLLKGGLPLQLEDLIFRQMFFSFLKYVPALLIIAALIESYLIKSSLET